MFKSVSSNNNGAVNELKEIDNVFNAISHFADVSNEGYPSIEEFSKLYPQIGIWGMSKYSLSELVESLIVKKKDILGGDDVELKNNFRVLYVINNVTYLKEADFGVDELREETFSYKYIILQKKKGTQWEDNYSLWLTKIKDRAGFVSAPSGTIKSSINEADANLDWLMSLKSIPQVRKLNSTVPKTASEKTWARYLSSMNGLGMKNLTTLFERCVDYKDVKEFHDLLSKNQIDDLSATDRKRVNDLYVLFKEKEVNVVSGNIPRMLFHKG